MNKRSTILLYLFSLITLTIYAQGSKIFVELQGKLAHFSNQVEVQDMSEYQYLLSPSTQRMIIPDDSTGKFQISIPLNAPNYFRIGRNTLYLSPGDKMELFIDYNNPALAIFNGPGSEANQFLRFTPFPKGGSYLEAGSRARENPQQTIDYILAAGVLRQKQLDSLKEVSDEFKRLEKGRIRADIINSLVDGQIPFYRPRSIRKDSVMMKKYGDEYAVLIQPLISSYSHNFVDVSLMKIVVYRDLVNKLFDQPGNETDLQQMKDWIKATAIINDMQKLSDKKLIAAYTPEIELIKNNGYRKAVLEAQENLLRFGKGDMAADFTAIDMNGQMIRLSSLKGKVIYVDLWATWCGPCLEEMPHYEELKSAYKNNSNIAFISLSIDDNILSWKKNIGSREAGGYQWLINRNQLAAYNIVGIPRILLIDKAFKIVDMNAPAPSSKKLPGIIACLLLD